MEVFRGERIEMEIGVRSVIVQRGTSNIILVNLTNDVVIRMVEGEWHNLRQAVGLRLQRLIMSRSGDDMGLFDTGLAILEGILPEGDNPGEVAVRFTIEGEEGTAEQRGVETVLNSIGHFEESALPALTRRVRMRAEVMDAEGDVIMVYFPDGKIVDAG